MLGVPGTLLFLPLQNFVTIILSSTVEAEPMAPEFFMLFNNLTVTEVKYFVFIADTNFCNGFCHGRKSKYMHQVCAVKSDAAMIS